MIHSNFNLIQIILRSLYWYIWKCIKALIFLIISCPFDAYRWKLLTISFNLSHKICQKTAAKKPDSALCIVNTHDGFKNRSWIYLSYLFDLPVMPICIQSHCHLSKKPIVTLLTTATLYLKCANLTAAQCGIHIEMSFLYLIEFISDSEYYYHPPVTLIKNK